MKRSLCILLACGFLFGCGMNNNRNEAAGEPNGQNNPIQVRNSVIQEEERYSGQDISKHLVALATSLPNVNDATAVVLGEFAIVGIDVNASLDRSEVGSIKYTVAEGLKKDPHGANAIVIADPDMNARLREIGNDIENGQPLQGIMNELADISGRLMPEVPADLVDPNPRETTEQPKNKLNNDEKQQLEQKQQEQSNYHKEDKAP